MKLSTRLAAAMVALAVLTAAAVGFVTYRNVESALLSSELERQEADIHLIAVEFESRIRAARADVIGFRSAVALAGIIRAADAGGIDPVDRTTLTEWKQRFSARLIAELGAKANYLQFRVIGLADGGREILRVDRQSASDTIRVVPDAELQRKGDTGYFKAAMARPRDDIYVSPLELNREHDAIEIPHVPVMRVATPLFTADARPFGILVINLDLRPAFESIRANTRPGHDTYLVNEHGDYLIHPDRTKEFGFEYGRQFNWRDDLPHLAAALGSNKLGVHVVEDAAGNSIVGALASVRLAGGPLVSVIETAPYAVVMASAVSIRRSTLSIGFAAVLAAALLAAFLARSLTKPLVQMTAAVKDFGDGKPAALPIEVGGEIGTLARAFGQMADEVREKTTELNREIEERRRIFETSLDLILITDKRGNFIRVSPSLEAILGYRPDEMVGRNGKEFLYADDLDSTRQEMRLARQGRDMRNFETRYVHKDGHPVTMVWSGVWSEPEQRHFFIGRDMTERIKLEQQLRHSQKMDAIGQLTGGVAHDFNNILTVITGTIEILAEGVAGDPNLTEIAQLIDEAAQRGAQLTAQLLAFARKQPLQPRQINPNSLLQETTKLLKPLLGENIEMATMLDESAWSAMVDPTQLSTALINLAVNARDAMPDGGKLTLETHNAVLDDSYARAHNEVQAGNYVMVAVSDTGSGMSDSIKDKIFEPFFSTKDIGKGTGLGLSMVYGFVKQSGGHIKVYSEEGSGTTIKLYLPRAGEQAQTSPAIAASAEIAGGTETILVVEDDTLVRNYVIAQLQGLGYTTLSAGNAAEALALVDAGAHFDLLFTDVIMPGEMNGRQLADALRKVRTAFKVLFTSGYTENAIIHHGRLDPGVILLNKPYRKSDLARMLRAALAA
jgi:PAS domain S-box-containing protein